MSQETLELVLATITKLQTIVDTNEELDVLWAEVKNIFVSEMSKLPDIPRSNYINRTGNLEKANHFGMKNLSIYGLKVAKLKKRI